MKQIKSPEDYAKALIRVSEIFFSKPDTPEAVELEALATLIEDYEKIHYQINLMTPYEIECAKAVVRDGPAASIEQFNICANHCPNAIKIAVIGAGVILASALEDAEERIKSLEKFVGGTPKLIENALPDYDGPLKSI